MAKIKDNDLIIDEFENIVFIDQFNNEHTITWDRSDQRYLFSSGITAPNYVNATNAYIDSRAPLSTDNDYIVPTIWIDSITLKYYILRKIDVNNNADWQEMAAGTVSSYDPRLTINNGSEPASPNPYDMWVVVE